MPAEDRKAGAVDRVMPLHAFAPEVVRVCRWGRRFFSHR